MFENERDESKKKEPKRDGMVSVLPLKDWRIVCNEHDIQCIKGEKIEVPKLFEQTLKTEQVIK